MGPLPPLCVIQSSAIGGGKEKGPQSQRMSQVVRKTKKKKFALGTDIGHACQLTSPQLDGRFRGQRGGEALLGGQTGCIKLSYNSSFRLSLTPECLLGIIYS